MEPLSFKRDFLPLKNLSECDKILGIYHLLLRALNLKNLEIVSAIILAQRSIIHRSYVSSKGLWMIATSLEEIGNPAILGGSLILYICTTCYRNGWTKLFETYSVMIQNLQNTYLINGIHTQKCECSLCLLALTAFNSPKV
jgi:hypothetical protein